MFLLSKHSAFHTDRLAEGMRELETIVEKRDMVLCAPMLLIYAHKRCKTVGKHSIVSIAALQSLN